VPLFSIIIPLYNCEKFIEKCLLGVLNQNFNSYEIIIINDCSKDRSLKICTKYREKYPKIKIINQKINKGVSNSRNLGIKSSIGEYVIFLDSDDYLEKFSLYKLSKFIENNKKADTIVVSHNASSDGKIFNKKITKINDNDAKIKFINEIPYFIGYCWRFVTKRIFLKANKIFFMDDARQFEDEEFVCKLLFFSKSIVFFNEKYYFKRLQNDGGLASTINFNSVKSCIVVLKGLLKLSSLKKVSSQKKIYCRKRIEKLLTDLYPLLFLTSIKNLITLSNYIYKNLNLFLMLKKYRHNSGLGAFINKNNKECLLDCRNIIEKNTLIQLNNLKHKNFYFFCMDKNSFALAKILMKHKYNIKGFLDNKSNLKNSKKFKFKFVPLKQGIKKIKKNIKNYIIICNQRNEHIFEILKQLVNSGVPKNRIFIKTYTLNLKEKIKQST
jgi:glycosyltransferase involved in cell wall biosynthesis